ncbi:hypothetical protein QOZ80_7BG0603220 [Eleusine coracana subsp. coracana]|nr:hypothetical protein QOZ80_7BG0603220 [Eleusine coracana subsp. coracana]
MGTDRGRGRSRSNAVDHISGLPDEILHIILLHLPSTAEAACTSVLSRRWRYVWTHVPVLSFSQDDHWNRGSTPKGIDAALRAHAAPTLDLLAIDVKDGVHVTPARVASWLNFASQRVAGELSIRCSSSTQRNLKLPVCERATEIKLELKIGGHLRLSDAGTFAALRVLTIRCHGIHVGDLERIVSVRCPLLQQFTLSASIGFIADDDNALSIRSASLKRFELCDVSGHITIDTPRLLRLEISRRMFIWKVIHTVHVIAPELVEVIWHGPYYPGHDQIVKTERHLRKLQMSSIQSFVRYATSLSLF